MLSAAVRPEGLRTGAKFAIPGSILFFYKSLETLAIWLFLICLILFAAKSTFRLVWEIKLYRLGDYDDLALRLKD